MKSHGIELCLEGSGHQQVEKHSKKVLARATNKHDSLQAELLLPAQIPRGDVERRTNSDQRRYMMSVTCFHQPQHMGTRARLKYLAATQTKGLTLCPKAEFKRWQGGTAVGNIGQSNCVFFPRRQQPKIAQQFLRHSRGTWSNVRKSDPTVSTLAMQKSESEAEIKAAGGSVKTNCVPIDLTAVMSNLHNDARGRRNAIPTRPKYGFQLRGLKRQKRNRSSGSSEQSLERSLEAMHNPTYGLYKGKAMGTGQRRKRQPVVSILPSLSHTSSLPELGSTCTKTNMIEPSPVCMGRECYFKEPQVCHYPKQSKQYWRGPQWTQRWYDLRPRQIIALNLRKNESVPCEPEIALQLKFTMADLFRSSLSPETAITNVGQASPQADAAPIRFIPGVGQHFPQRPQQFEERNTQPWKLCEANEKQRHLKSTQWKIQRKSN